MSLRLFLVAMRCLARPLLARTREPVRARQDFNLLSRLLRVPPYLLHLVDHGAVPLHWGPVRRRQDDWAILYLHGGGNVAGSPLTHIGLTSCPAGVSSGPRASGPCRI